MAKTEQVLGIGNESSAVEKLVPMFRSSDDSETKVSVDVTHGARFGEAAGSRRGETTVRIARTLEEVRELRPIWQRLCTHPNSDLDFFLSVVQQRKEVVGPHVIILTPDGEQETLLIGRLEDITLEIKLGYKVLFRPRVRSITIVYGGLLGTATEAASKVLQAELMRSLAEGEADVVWFNHLGANSQMYRTVSQASTVLFKDPFPVPNQHWKASLAGGFKEFQRTRSDNTRHNLRRYSKRFQDAVGKDMSIKCFREVADLERILADTDAIASKSYHRGLGVGFVNNAETRELVRLALEQRQFRGYILYIRDIPSAFWNGVLCGKTFFTSTTGFDPALRDYRPGTFLLMKVFEDLCDHESIEAVDFGLGDAQYKRDFCDDNWQEMSVYLFAPTFRGMLFNGLRATSIGLSRAAERTIGQNVLGKIKRAWRNRSTPKK